MFAAIPAVIMQQTLLCLQQYLWLWCSKHCDVCSNTCNLSGYSAADIMILQQYMQLSCSRHHDVCSNTFSHCAANIVMFAAVSVVVVPWTS